MYINIILIVAIIAVPLLAQLYIKSTYGKYSEIDNNQNISVNEIKNLNK